MILRTEAIVLRTLDYRETSRIVTLFTRDRGKVSVLARGVRRPKSAFGATLQPLAYIEVVYYYKETRTLHTLRESSHRARFSHLGADLEKLALGLRMLELVAALMQEEEAQPAVFELLVSTLGQLDAAEARAANLLAFFQLRLAAALGFAPEIDRDAVAALPEAGGFLALDRGAVLPLETREAGTRRGSRTALRAFAIFARAALDDIMRMDLDDAHRSETEGLIEAFLRYHVEQSYPTRGEKVMGALRREARRRPPA